MWIVVAIQLGIIVGQYPEYGEFQTKQDCQRKVFVKYASPHYLIDPSSVDPSPVCVISTAVTSPKFR